MPRTNALIGSIEPEHWAAFRDRFSPVELGRGVMLHHSGDPVERVQFPTTAVVVLGVETVAGESVNVALLGREGAVGVLEACGSRQTYSKASVQFGGVVWQTSAANYRALYESSSALRTATHKYVESVMMEAQQYIACNALHSVENRLARTLLDAADKFGSVRLPITQVALAQLLGVQRTTIAAAISGLQRSGQIRSGRGGVIEIVEPQRLAASACSCRESLAFAREDIQAREIVSCDG